MNRLARKAPPCPSGRSGHVWSLRTADTVAGYEQKCRHCDVVRVMSNSHACRGYYADEWTP